MQPSQPAPPVPARAPRRKRFSLDFASVPWVTVTRTSSSDYATHCVYAPPRLRHPVSAPVKAYLLAFNALSAAAWGYLLYLTVWFIVTPRTAAETLGNPSWTILGQKATGTPPGSWLAKAADHLSGAYDFHGLGEATKYVQTLAVMEVVHAALGLVRSPVGTVASQVASRLWTVWGVVEMCPSVSSY